MKRFLVLTLTAMLVLPLFAQRRRVESAIPPERATEARQIQYQTRNFMKNYPDARILDLYEYWAEAYLGPNKISTDTVGLATTMYNTIQEVGDTMLGPDYEYIGVQRKYVRVNLRLMRDGRLPMRDFVSAVLDTEYEAPQPDLEKWRDQWAFILLSIKESDISLNGSQMEEDIINDALKKNKTRPTKSALMSKGYYYFYYLVSVKHFREELLPYLNGTKPVK